MNRFGKIVGVFTACLTLTGLGVQKAQANLLDGKTVQTIYHFPTVGNNYTGPVNSLVGAGFEVFNFPADDAFAIDYSDTNIFFDYNTFSASWSTVSFNGVEINDPSNNIDAITSVTINAATNMAGFSASNISFDSDHIFINWQGLSFDSNTIVSLDLNGGSSPVPSPAAALFSLPAIAAFKRRRSR